MWNYTYKIIQSYMNKLKNISILMLSFLYTFYDNYFIVDKY